MDNLTQAPWRLTGEGYVMLFKFPREYLIDNGFLNGIAPEKFIGGLSCIIFANYFSSPVGPYQELLFLPGKVICGHKKGYTITKAYVSSEASQINGRQNWAIPKETATFNVEKVNQENEHIRVSRDQRLVLDVSIKASGLSWPLHSGFLPSTIIQFSENYCYQTHLKGEGLGQLAQNLKVDVNPDFFPHFAFYKHVLIMRIKKFKLRLPITKRLEIR